MTTCAWVGRGARGWVGVEVGAPVTQAFLGARSLQAGLSRGGTPPAVLARWREEKKVGDLFLDQNLVDPETATDHLLLGSARPRGGGARHAERGVRPAGRGHLRHLSRARHSPPRPKARGQVLLRPSLRPPHSDRCAPLAGPPGGEGAQIAVGRGDSWLSPEDDRDVPAAADQALIY